MMVERSTEITPCAAKSSSKSGENRNLKLSVELREHSSKAVPWPAFEVLQFKADKPVGGFGVILRADG